MTLIKFKGWKEKVLKLKIYAKQHVDEKNWQIKSK